MLAAPSKPIFDFTKLKRTTGWHNNCGFNCFAHFLASKLENGELQARFSHDPSYTMLLQTFQEYYGLSKLPTWEQINLLRQKFPVPTDWEAIFAPVFRKHLEKLMINDAQYLWDKQAPAALSAYLVSGTVEDVAIPIFNAMIEIMGELKAFYDQELERLDKLPLTEEELTFAQDRLIYGKKYNPSDEQIVEQVKFKRKNDLQDSLQAQAKHYWMEKGCRYYAQAMGDLQGNVMASVDQLDLLAQTLHIGLEVHTPAGAQNLPEPGFVWLLKTFNSGAHWTLEADNVEQAQDHNKYYDTLSGVFKTYDHAAKTVETDIINAVRASMEKMIALNPTSVAKPAIVPAFKAAVAPITVSAPTPPVAVVKQVTPVVAPQSTVATPKTVHDWLALPEDKIRELYNTAPDYSKMVVNFFEAFELGTTNFDGFLALMKMLSHPVDREILFGQRVRYF